MRLISEKMPDTCCKGCFKFLLYNGTEQKFSTINELAIVCPQHVGCCTILLTGRKSGPCEHTEEWVNEIQDKYEQIRDLESQHPSSFSFVSHVQYIAWGPICLQAPSSDNVEEPIKFGRLCKGFAQSDTHICDRDIWTLTEDAPESRLGSWTAQIDRFVLCLYPEYHNHS